MRFLPLLYVIFLLALFFLSPGGKAHADDRSISMLWWNIENLFDTRDDPATEDGEFTPNGKKQWTEKKLRLKCIRIAHVLKVIALKTGRYPEILAFAEVENREVFKHMLSFFPGKSYTIAYHASRDPRGIDTALAYDAEKIALDTTAAYTVNLEERNTRDILLYRFSAGGAPFFLLLNHWPSRYLGKSWSEPSRLAAAKTARTVLDSLRSSASRPDIIVMGDFNDEPDDPSIKKILNATVDDNVFLQNPKDKLYNCWGKTSGKGSCYFAGKWLRLDQVMVSDGLFDESGLSISENAFSCFHFSHMETGSLKRPYATYRGKKYLGGYSDHFPLLFRARLQ